MVVEKCGSGGDLYTKSSILKHHTHGAYACVSECVTHSSLFKCLTMRRIAIHAVLKLEELMFS